MKTTLTRIHLGLGEPEIGVQFELDDGAGGTVTQRAFVVVDDAALSPVWLAAQTALAAKLSALPLDMPPGAVTTALMKQRTAEHAERAAREAQLEAEKKRVAADQARQAAEAERAQLTAASTKLAIDCAALDAEAAEKLAKLAALDEQIAAKRAAVAEPPVEVPSG